MYRHADEAIGFARFSADGARIMAVDASNSVFIWDTATGEVLGSIENRPLDSTSVIDPSMHKPTEPVPDISADDIQAART